MSYVGHKKLMSLREVSSHLILLAESNFDVKTGGRNGITGGLRS
jgi:hypothetical protein